MLGRRCWGAHVGHALQANQPCLIFPTADWRDDSGHEHTQAAHIQGIGSIGDRTLLLLDIAQLMQNPALGLKSHRLQ